MGGGSGCKNRFLSEPDTHLTPAGFGCRTCISGPGGGVYVSNDEGWVKGREEEKDIECREERERVEVSGEKSRKERKENNQKVII